MFAFWSSSINRMRQLLTVLACLVLFASGVKAQWRPARSHDREGILQAEERIKNPGSFDLTFYPDELMGWQIGFSEGLAKITVGGKSGFIDRSGNIVIKPQFSRAGRFAEGMAPVEINGAWGFIDRAGTIVIEPRFEWAFPFGEGRALVSMQGKWGFINSAGEMVIEPQFDEAGGFSEGLARVRVYAADVKKYKSGFIDRQGKWAIDPTFDGAQDFQEGLAEVCKDIPDPRYRVVSDCFYIDHGGRTVLAPQYSTDRSGFYEGLSVVTETYSYGYINKTGKLVVPLDFQNAEEFREGLALVSVDYVWGFIDRKGRQVIPLKFKWAQSFSEGLASVQLKSASPNHWGYINRSGRIVLQPRFDWAWPFSEGRAAVAMGQKVGYIDRKGKFIWKPSS
jgi:WG containing repeat